MSDAANRRNPTIRTPRTASTQSFKCPAASGSAGSTSQQRGQQEPPDRQVRGFCVVQRQAPQGSGPKSLHCNSFIPRNTFQASGTVREPNTRASVNVAIRVKVRPVVSRHQQPVPQTPQSL